jgi:hypothetical protein
MDKLRITASVYTINAHFETATAHKTVAVFRKLLPYENRIIDVRWSGEVVGVPLGDLNLSLTYENYTSYPAPGQMIVYPGGTSETEILLAYGGVHFASNMGQLAANHFLTITSDLDKLAEVGRSILWEGAKAIRIKAA